MAVAWAGAPAPSGDAAAGRTEAARPPIASAATASPRPGLILVIDSPKGVWRRRRRPPASLSVRSQAHRGAGRSDISPRAGSRRDAAAFARAGRPPAGSARERGGEQPAVPEDPRRAAGAPGDAPQDRIAVVGDRRRALRGDAVLNRLLAGGVDRELGDPVPECGPVVGGEPVGVHEQP